MQQDEMIATLERCKSDLEAILLRFRKARDDMVILNELGGKDGGRPVRRFVDLVDRPF